MDNIEFIYSLFNQYLFQDAKNNVEQIEYYISTNPALCGNRLAFELVNAVKTYSFDTIDAPLFQSILLRNGYNGAECQKIMSDIVRWKSYGKDQIQPSKDALKDIIASGFINRASRKFKDNPYEFYKYIKNSEFNVGTDSASTTLNFADIDMNSIIADANVEVYPSMHKKINDSFPCNGYEGGQLVAVSFPAGIGKTLFLMEEAISILTRTDASVYMLFLGDMKHIDVIVRMGAILTGQSFAYARSHLMDMKKILDQAFGRRLTIEIADAGEVNVDDFAEKMLKLKPKVFFVDYDGNFKANLGGDDGNSMYLEYGNIYNKLIMITRRTNALGFVASQPNKFAMTQEIITEDMLSDSSKKAHACDVIITGGVYIESQNHIGCMNIAKSRRGEAHVVMPYIRLNNGRFKLLNTTVYSYLKSIKEKKDFSENEIDDMLNKSIMAGGFTNNQANQMRSKVENPFSRK